MASAETLRDSKISDDKKQMVLSSYNKYRQFPTVMATFALGDWSAADKVYLDHSLSANGNQALPPMTLEAGKFKVTLEGKDYVIELYDASSNTYFINGKLFSLDSTKPLANQVEQLKKLLNSGSHIGSLFIDRAEAQAQLVVGGVVAIILILLWIGGSAARLLDYINLCMAVDKSTDDFQKMSKADFAQFSMALAKAKDSMSKVLATYKKTCTGQIPGAIECKSSHMPSSMCLKDAALTCKDDKEALECFDKHLGPAIASIEKTRILNRTDISESDKATYRSRQEALTNMLPQISKYLNQAQGPDQFSSGDKTSPTGGDH